MKIFAENRKARNSYEFSESIEAGIVLTGSETKSIRNGGVSIVDAFAIIENEEAILREMNIEQYKFSSDLDYNAKAPRKLLLHKKEIKRLIGLTSQFLERYEKLLDSFDRFCPNSDICSTCPFIFAIFIYC